MILLYFCFIKNLIELDIDICTTTGHNCDKRKKEKKPTILSSFTEMTTELMLKIISPLLQGTEEGSKHDHVTPVKPEQLNHCIS